MEFQSLSDADGAVPCDDSSIMHISKVEELYLTICRLNKKVCRCYSYLSNKYILTNGHLSYFSIRKIVFVKDFCYQFELQVGIFCKCSSKEDFRFSW